MDNDQKTWETVVDGLSIDGGERSDPNFWESEFAAAPSEELLDETVHQVVELAISEELGTWDLVETVEGLDAENAIFQVRENGSPSNDELRNLIDELKNRKKGKEHHDRSGEAEDSDSRDEDT